MAIIKYGDAKGKSLEELRSMCAANPSALVQAFGESLRELSLLDGAGLIKRLRGRDFELEHDDIHSVHNISMDGLDPYLRRPQSGIRTKILGLPTLIFYERLSKDADFGSYNGVMNEFWEVAQRMRSGGFTFYGKPERILELISKDNDVLDDGLVMLSLRPDRVFKNKVVIRCSLINYAITS